MKKNERDWFAIFAGKKVPGMNPQMKLQARLVRAVFQKKSSEIDREIRENKEPIYKEIVTELIKQGYLQGHFKKESSSFSKTTK